MKLYTRENGNLRAVAFEDKADIQGALDLINVRHMALRELKSVGVVPDKRAPILLVVSGNSEVEFTPSVA